MNYSVLNSECATTDNSVGIYSKMDSKSVDIIEFLKLQHTMSIHTRYFVAIRHLLYTVCQYDFILTSQKFVCITPQTILSNIQIDILVLDTYTDGFFPLIVRIDKPAQSIGFRCTWNKCVK